MFRRVKYFLMLNLFPPIVYLFLSLLRLTCRVEHVNRGALDAGWDRGENFIVSFWHGRLLMIPFAYSRGRGKVLISRHRDGEFISRIVRYFGIGSVRGSHRKGSFSSVREIMANLKDGYDMAITPDGPKGPRYVIKEGLIELAQLTGKPLVALTYGASKKKLFIPGTGSYCPCPFHGLSLSGVIHSI
jgi:lysophospholipid acyltransferase (LPLAT)-like uncharacterized protein